MALIMCHDMLIFRVVHMICVYFSSSYFLSGMIASRRVILFRAINM